jgi:hypothetical protein
MQQNREQHAPNVFSLHQQKIGLKSMASKTLILALHVWSKGDLSMM